MERVDDAIELDEFGIVQNHVLGAHAMREFVKYFQQNSSNHAGPPLVLMMPLLPLVFNKAISTSISKRHYIEGSLIKTISEDKTLYSGLQERMEKMADQSFESLSLAFALGLVTYNQETTEIKLLLEKKPKLTYSADYDEIINAARRLGTWFAKLSTEELISVFKINF